MPPCFSDVLDLAGAQPCRRVIAEPDLVEDAPRLPLSSGWPCIYCLESMQASTLQGICFGTADIVDRCLEACGSRFDPSHGLVCLSKPSSDGLVWKFGHAFA